jgi:hypothetical protein
VARRNLLKGVHSDDRLGDSRAIRVLYGFDLTFLSTHGLSAATGTVAYPPWVYSASLPMRALAGDGGRSARTGSTPWQRQVIRVRYRDTGPN